MSAQPIQRDEAQPPIVLAMTGASGAAYAVRLLEVLVNLGEPVHLVVSPSGAQVLEQELGISTDPLRPRLEDFAIASANQPVCHAHDDFRAGIASGSFPTRGMVIAPCSMSTLGTIAGGITTNLIARAADVHLKERRKLILVPRETPLGVIHLRNMLAVSEAGAIVLPAAPGWYHRPAQLGDLVDFLVARICDQLGIGHGLGRRWGQAAEERDN